MFIIMLSLRRGDLEEVNYRFPSDAIFASLVFLVETDVNSSNGHSVWGAFWSVSRGGCPVEGDQRRGDAARAVRLQVIICRHK